MRALRTLTLLIALAGASTAHAEDRKPKPLSPAHAEKLLVFYNELVDQAVQHKDDCAGLAAAVDGVVNRQINTIQMTWAMKNAKQVVPRDVQAKMDQRAPELVAALRRCLHDERVKKAFRRMKMPADWKQP